MDAGACEQGGEGSNCQAEGRSIRLWGLSLRSPTSMKTRRESRQMNTMPSAAGKAAASTAPAKHQFVGTNPTKRTAGPSVMANPLVGPAGAAYSVKSPYTNGGK